jgi:SLT domain-containing protein
MNRAAKENVQKQLPSHIARGQTAGNVAGQIGGAVFPFERGGIVRKPTRAVLGEKGKPEAVIPLSSDKRSKRDRRKILEEAIKIVEKEKTASISYANRRPLVYDSLPVILRLR